MALNKKRKSLRQSPLSNHAKSKLIEEQQRLIVLQQKALDAASAAARDKNILLSIISHEIRSPLQGVTAALDVELARNPGPQQQEFLRKVEGGLRRIFVHVNDLATVAAGEEGGLEMRPELFEVSALVESVVTQIRPLADEKGIGLAYAAEPNLGSAIADAHRIEQVLTNLVGNAVKYSKSGTVTIAAELTDHSALRLSVTDRGVGIEAHHQDELFVPYNRFGPIDRNQGSAGIGLAVVKTLLNHLGGSIAVRSAVEVGSEFVATIPVTLPDPSRLGRSERAKPLVLFVDDDNIELARLRQLSASLQIDCDTAQSAAEAANMLAATEYDAVFVKLDLPVKSGRQLASESRRGAGPNREAFMIALTEATAPATWPFDEVTLGRPDANALLRVMASLRR